MGGRKLKVIPFASAFLLLSSPALANDLQTPPQQQLSLQEMPGDFRWTMLDEDGAPQDEAPAPLVDAALTRSLMFPANTPTATIEAQMRLVAAQVVEEARRAGNVESLRFRLRVRCVSEERMVKRDLLAAASSVPWIWTSLDGDPQTVRATMEMCQVSVYQSVQTRETAVKQKPYSVLLSPIGDPAE